MNKKNKTSIITNTTGSDSDLLNIFSDVEQGKKVEYFGYKYRIREIEDKPELRHEAICIVFDVCESEIDFLKMKSSIFLNIGDWLVSQRLADSDSITMHGPFNTSDDAMIFSRSLGVVSYFTGKNSDFGFDYMSPNECRYLNDE